MQLGAYLNKHGISEKDFAAKIGTTHVSVNRYVNARRIPTRRIMTVIEKETGGAVKAQDFYDSVEASV